MKRRLLIYLLAAWTIQGIHAQKLILPTPSAKPNKAQQQQIARKYGMFIHFGINTFHDEEWTDGSKPASSYRPTRIDAEQWVRTAKDAGMKYIILITKHHDGFCLWDSKYTEYDVANSDNQTNVVEAVAKACKKYDIGLGLYYSLWDRKVNGDVADQSQDAAYNEYMIKQLKELIAIAQKHTHIVEFWFDGGWVKQNYRWPVMDICYFPSDFRLGDPQLPVDDDPKTFTHDGKDYYMPWESTVCISERWFYNTKDTKFKSIDELEKLYKQCTKNDNILILNCPPNRDGQIRTEDVRILKELRARLHL